VRKEGRTSAVEWPVCSSWIKVVIDPSPGSPFTNLRPKMEGREGGKDGRKGRKEEREMEG
jgi:hypothetical protein